MTNAQKFHATKVMVLNAQEVQEDAFCRSWVPWHHEPKNVKGAAKQTNQVYTHSKQFGKSTMAESTSVVLML
jgi:hypothetical protein